MVQRTGDQGEGTVLFVQNNFYYDAFFLKAIGTSSSAFALSHADGPLQLDYSVKRRVQ